MSLLLASPATEVGLSGCTFGCKVMRCRCGYLFVYHSGTYGHTEPSHVQHSSTGARCTCAA